MKKAANFFAALSSNSDPLWSANPNLLVSPSIVGPHPLCCPTIYPRRRRHIGRRGWIVRAVGIGNRATDNAANDAASHCMTDLVRGVSRGGHGCGHEAHSQTRGSEQFDAFDHSAFSSLKRASDDAQWVAQVRSAPQCLIVHASEQNGNVQFDPQRVVWITAIALGYRDRSLPAFRAPF